MRAWSCVVVVALILTLLPAARPAMAAEHNAPPPSSHTVPSVGTRLDAPRAPVSHTGPGAVPYRPLDQVAFGLAKADAARRAANGPSSYRRNDFAVSASPSSQSVTQGASASYVVTTSVTSGSARPVALSVSGLPAGVTGSFDPATVNAGDSSTLTVSASASAATGTVGLVITGTYSSPPTVHTTAVSLTVVASLVNDFAIGVSPSAQTVAAGSTATYAVATTVVSGSAETVSLSATGLPAGATATFTPSSVTAGQGATLAVATDASTPPGAFTLTLTGTAASATHSATASLTVTAPASGGPRLGVSWEGQTQGNIAPPDPTGAVGPASYIEMINSRYGIYDRSGALVQEFDLGELTRFPVDELSDPQIVWDPYAGRFYYLVVDFYTSQYAFGYSKTSDPHDAVTDFCHYSVDALYSSLYLPDYPKLAVTQDFVLVGANIFLLLSFYTGSDIDWWVKPTNPVCPGSLGAGGKFEGVRNVDGSYMSTPVPAVAADRSSGGWVVGTADVSTSGSASFVTVYKVDRNAQGYASLSGPKAVSVDAYDMPANAPQAGTTFKLDTFDTRFTHAMAGYDPRIGTTAIWTTHGVFGGAGSEMRWYELAALATPQLAQSGRVTDPDLYVFNGAVSPDRAADDVTGPTAVTGANMVLGFNTSSAATYPTIQMVSQRGAGSQSAWVAVQQSLGPNVDFSCGGGTVPDLCRWGDYAGATPDPLVSSGGQVWLSAEWNVAPTDGQNPVWRTWNWSASP